MHLVLKRYTPDVEEAVDISITYEGYIKKANGPSRQGS